jgi:hypothetical protein
MPTCFPLRWGLAELFFGPHWPQMAVLLILDSQVARIIGVSNWNPASFAFLYARNK